MAGKSKMWNDVKRSREFGFVFLHKLGIARRWVDI